jgi:hypothetical protein
VQESGKGRIRGTSSCPTVGTGAISTTGIKVDAGVAKSAAPDNHFAASPDCRVRVSRRGRVGHAGGCPAIRGGVVSATSIAIVKRGVGAGPDHHFAAAPDCRVTDAAERRVGSAGYGPAIVNRIIPAAGVQIDRLDDM